MLAKKSFSCNHRYRTSGSWAMNIQKYKGNSFVFWGIHISRPWCSIKSIYYVSKKWQPSYVFVWLWPLLHYEFCGYNFLCGVFNVFWKIFFESKKKFQKMIYALRVMWQLGYIEFHNKSSKLNIRVVRYGWQKNMQNFQKILNYNQKSQPQVMKRHVWVLR